MKKLIMAAAILFLTGCSLLYVGYSSRPLFTESLIIGETTYNAAMKKYGQPALTAITPGEGIRLSYFFKTPTAKVDKSLIMRGDYRFGCVRCSKLTLSFGGDIRGGLNNFKLFGYSVENPELENIFKKSMTLINDQGFGSAKVLLEQAAKEHYTEAEYILGLMYARGDAEGGVDYQQAYYWLQRAAIMGQKNALYDLGIMFRNGEGVPVDRNKAKALYLSSAQKGYPVAAYELAKIFQEEGDRLNADKWFAVAEKAGYPPPNHTF